MANGQLLPYSYCHTWRCTYWFAYFSSLGMNAAFLGLQRMPCMCKCSINKYLNYVIHTSDDPVHLFSSHINPHHLMYGEKTRTNISQIINERQCRAWVRPQALQSRYLSLGGSTSSSLDNLGQVVCLSVPQLPNLKMKVIIDFTGAFVRIN